MQSRVSCAFACAAALAFLAGCNGSGTSSVEGPSDPPTLISLDDLPENGTVRLYGTTLSGRHSFYRRYPETSVGSDVWLTEYANSDSYLDVTMEDGVIAEVKSGNLDSSFDVSLDNRIIPTVYGLELTQGVDATGRTYFLAKTDLDTRFKHSAIAFWMLEEDFANVTWFSSGPIVNYGRRGVFGAGSFGTSTEVTDMPRLGTATYTGAAAGLRTIFGSRPMPTIADATLAADFGSSTFDLAFTNTKKVDPRTLEQRPAPEYDVSGEFDIVGSEFADSFQYNCSLRTCSVFSVTGRFYGPDAAEVGGVFQTGDLHTGTSNYRGVFGAAR